MGKPRGFFLGEGFAITALILVGACWGQTRPGASSAALTSRQVIADYDAALRRKSDGRLDIPLLIQQLKGLKVNVYFYLIWFRNTDWEDLQRFLPEARAAGIEVWVYLAPPTESLHKTLYSEPFRLDYIRWGEEIGKLSAQHPNLTAFVIDDFWADSRFFTAEYVGRMRAAGRRANPNLLFLPLMYYRQINRRFVLEYKDVIDGVVAAYPRNAQDIRTARNLLNDLDEGPARWVFSYPPKARSNVGDFAEVRRTYAVDPVGRYLLRLTGGGSFVGPRLGYHMKQVLMDGEVVWQEDVAGGAQTARPIQVDVTGQVKGKASVILTLRAIDLKGVSNFAVEVTWSNVEAEGLRPAEGSAWTANTQGRWQVTFEAARHGEGAFQIPLVVMIAASREAFPRRVGLPGTPENIRDHAEMAFMEMRQGNADGVVTYMLNKQPGNPYYAAVQTAFLKATQRAPSPPSLK